MENTVLSRQLPSNLLLNDRTEMSTQDLQWLLVRKSNSYLVKQKGLGRVFSREPGNIASLHSYKYSGIVNDKAVGITPNEKQGVDVFTKKTKVSPRAVKGARIHTTVKGGPRRVAGAVANITAKHGYRPDLRKGMYFLRSWRTTLEPPGKYP